MPDAIASRKNNYFV